MESLARRRCFHHALREAVARCPDCERFFCRECVSDHEDRVLCSACLARRVAPAETTRNRIRWLARAGLFSVGLLTVWLIFYGLGRWLLSVPSAFHEGTIWQQILGEEQ
jgi:hypothetical protein